MKRGTVANVLTKGFGWIRPEGVTGRNGEIFFHASVLKGLDFDERLRGMEVEYETEKTDRGLAASMVRAAS